MRSVLLVCAFLSAAAVAKAPRPAPVPALQSADLILHTSRSEQSAAIRIATRSVYSHVGIIEVANDGVFVIEAIGPVTRTPLERFKKRGLAQRWTIVRDASLTEAQREAI